MRELKVLKEALDFKDHGESLADQELPENLDQWVQLERMVQLVRRVLAVILE